MKASTVGWISFYCACLHVTFLENDALENVNALFETVTNTKQVPLTKAIKYGRAMEPHA